MDKDNFTRHKNKYRKILNQETFNIACMKFEKSKDYQDIAKQTKLSGHHVRRILSSSCTKIRKAKLKGL